jgi:hypothetical protein
VYEEDGKTVASKTKTDANGNFKMTLNTGNYVIYTRAGPSASDLKTTHFAIIKDQVTRLPNLIIDTGLG